jgi:filamentous hemagglutinin
MLASQNREIQHYCPWGKKIINNIVSDNKNFSEIIATNDLKLTSSTGNIINKSKLASKGNITLAAAKDITNNSTVNTITNGENISSILLETASIEATNNLKILAGNNFENKAANLTTTQGDIDINVGNNINITSQQLRNKTTYSWGDKDEGGTITNDKTTNLQSSLTAKGNINLTSNNNIIIQAANINADNNIDINAGNGLYLLTAQNRNYPRISSQPSLTFN